MHVPPVRRWFRLGYLEFVGDPRCTGKGPPCAGLLDDFATVLEDRGRWPTHLCYDILRWSVETWALGTKLDTGPGGAVSQWQGAWPLPIGRQALEDELLVRYEEDRDQLWNLVPFDSEEEAIWAVRIEKGTAVLDLFGLAAYQTKVELKEGYTVSWKARGGGEHAGEVVGFETNPQGVKFAIVRVGLCDWGGGLVAVPVDQLELARGWAPIQMGNMAYVLRGQDVSLFDLVLNAKRWWAGFSGQSVGSGRPRDSGAFSSADAFRRALRLAVETLHSQGCNVTREKAAGLLRCDVSTLKRWTRRAGFSSWEEAKKVG